MTAPCSRKRPASGGPLLECAQFADGYTWGPVKLADVHIAGETAALVAIHLLGNPAFANRTVPAACSSFVNVEENTVAQLGSKGILGVGNFLQDCGGACAAGSQDGTAYSVCPSSSTQCQPVAVPLGQQVSNPVAAFAADNNGVPEFPAVTAPGTATLAGSLVFGAGTQSNNKLAGTKVYTLDAEGNFATTIDGLGSFPRRFVDSGSNGYFFDDAGLTACPGGDNFFYCPAAQTSFNATITSQSGVAGSFPFKVDNAETDFNNTNATAFPNLAGSAGSGLGAETFDCGVPVLLRAPRLRGVREQDGGGGQQRGSVPGVLTRCSFQCRRGCASSGRISRADTRTNRVSSAAATAVRPAHKPHQRPMTPWPRYSPSSRIASGSPTR